jgi:S1-C subfamily serine protease
MEPTGADYAMDVSTIDTLKASAREAIRKLNRVCEDEDVVGAKKLVEALRNVAAYDEMGQLAEAISRRDPRDAKNRRLYAQYLINTGKATAAIDLLTPLKERLAEDDPELAEVMGLIGRANKQIFFDAGDKSQPSVQEALAQAVAAYRVPFEMAPNLNTWHGVNLLAVLACTRRLGLRVAPELSPTQIAKTVVAALDATPEQKRDKDWYLPTLAEASLGLDDWEAVESNVRAYAASEDAKPFQIESTLRQFTEIWDVESIDERGRGLVATLRARLLQLSGGEINVAPTELQRWQKQVDPPKGQLEAILGSQGPQTYQWWKTGLERARSVASIRQKLGSRIGTGFLVHAASLGLRPPEELLVLTNFHVVNESGASIGIRPGDAEVVFEAVDTNKVYSVSTILWSSPVISCDASVLRLQEAVMGINPTPLATTLPIVQPGARVYVVGYPGGRDLAFSFQDNELLDHEGPPGGNPQIKGVSRVHYRAPTEPGSSGSPVFNAGQWEVIALHHMGLKTGMLRLNGKDGSYAANEGISMLSIKEAIVSGAQ